MAVATLPDPSWVSDVGPVPGLDLLAWDLHERPDRAGEIEFVVPPYLDPRQRLELLGELPNLRVVQLLTAGYDAARPHLPAGARLANAAGVHDASTAELTLALILASLRGIPEFALAQRDSTWIPTRIWPSLADRRVLVVGYGQVGRAIVRRLLPFEVEVTAVASRPRDGDDLLQHVHGVDELPALLPEQDVVVLIVPLTSSTTHLVDASFLAAMKDGALLVNMARGPVVDTGALLAETAAGRLRAALDVTDPEPLPPGHPLWTRPGVLISPHVGGASAAFRPRALALIRAQLRAHAAGAGLDNVVVEPAVN